MDTTGNMTNQTTINNSTIQTTETTTINSTTTQTTTVTTTASSTTTQTTTDTTTTSSTTTQTTTVTTTASTTSSTISTTTDTTTTTMITYAPTGIYALQISPCATWNKTGITVAGNSNTTAGSDGASLNAPVGIFLDNNYTLYIADRDNHRIVKYDVNATTGVVVAGNGTPGNSPSQLRLPKGVAVDQMGAIIVADGGNFRIQRFPFGSTVATTVAINSSANLLGDMRDLHIDVNNNIYITDSDYSRVVKFYPNNENGVILAGNSGAGSAAHQLQGSYGNFIDGNDTLYVADSGNHRVQMWPAGATNGTTIAGITNTPGSGLLRLKSPMQIIVDNNGYYYIADSGNNRIVKWTSNYAAGGTCIAGCTGSVGNASNQLNTPRDLKFDASGNLYVSDRDNNRVQKFMLEIQANCSISG
ncbi:unnamed protein product [Rotaria sp. Silwood2]|nr:unnamed protein product [Rotaria sp. Silwood2]CAF4411579.1 unnamed protein product [Rotaria sp. Silwood2]